MTHEIHDRLSFNVIFARYSFDARITAAYHQSEQTQTGDEHCIGIGFRHRRGADREVERITCRTTGLLHPYRVSAVWQWRRVWRKKQAGQNVAANVAASIVRKTQKIKKILPARCRQSIARLLLGRLTISYQT